MKMILTKDQIEMFEKMATVITHDNGDKYMHLPYWIKATDKEDVFEVFSFGRLPNDLKELITELSRK